VTPRLAVTQEQAEDIASAFAMKRAWAPVTMRLPERPTMPYDDPSPLRYHDFRPIDVPIPEGTRVEVGWWAGLYLGQEDWRNEWRPVTYATLAEVRHVLQAGIPWTEGRNDYEVALSHIEPAGEDQ
jgi:hypothetical protein